MNRILIIASLLFAFAAGCAGTASTQGPTTPSHQADPDAVRFAAPM